MKVKARYGGMLLCGKLPPLTEVPSGFIGTFVGGLEAA